jgi:hypothetical protein
MLLWVSESGATGHRLTGGSEVLFTGLYIAPEAELTEKRRHSVLRLRSRIEAPQARACVHLALQPFGYEKELKKQPRSAPSALDAFFDVCIGAILIRVIT